MRQYGKIGDRLHFPPRRKSARSWGLGSATKYDPGPWEGELRNLWKPTKQEGLWFFGGNLMQARHYSLYVGLQLKVTVTSASRSPSEWCVND